MQAFLDRISGFSPKRLALLAYELQTRIEELESAGAEPVAIVGVGCRLPGGVGDPDSYWTLLHDGVDAIREVPRERWDIEKYYDGNPEAPGKMSTRWGGFLTNIDGFDPQFFGISPREAESMDPQQRLILEVGWEALENAAIAPGSIFGTKTGVFVGMSASDYYHVIRASGIRALDAYTASGTAHSIASGRLSYVLGAQGPCVSIDTSCSSSLVAIHTAVQSLRIGECDLALAGGVNLVLNPDITIALSKAHMMAPDGRCKAFDARADGFVRSEGCGMVVLKRLGEAQKAGDRIIAVIRGSAVNQDGRSNGLTAPNGTSQEAVIRAALDNAGLEPSRVSYVEAHGTGTSLGDPIEVQALGSVFGSDRDVADPLIVGSVKTNIGHLEAAAGVAAIVKVALALQHAELPPQLHLEQPNPFIPWNELPVRVSTRLTPWEQRDGRSRVAGVSSFGFSGTNAHIILEEAPSTSVEREQVESPLHVLAISARTDEALAALMDAYNRRLNLGDDQLSDIAYTADTGRDHLSHRIAIVASSRAQAGERLKEFRATGHAAGVLAGVVAAAGRPKVAFVFTGQGSYQADAVRTLYKSFAVFRAALDRVAEIVRTALPQDLLSVVFEPRLDSPANRSDYAQPATFAIEYGLAMLWKSWGTRPSAVIGHGLGEYVAACIAGVLGLEDALKLVVARGRLMNAISADSSLDLASPRISAMLDDFAQVAATTMHHAAELDIVSSVTGDIIGADSLNASYWTREASVPVRFDDWVSTLTQQDYNVFIDVGAEPIPAEVISAAMKQRTATWLPSFEMDHDASETMLLSLATLYTLGGEIDWTGVYQERNCRKVVLPTYPFQRERYWIPDQDGNDDVPPAIASLFHEVKWREVTCTPGKVAEQPRNALTWLVVGGEEATADALALELRKNGDNPVVISGNDTVFPRELLNRLQREPSAGTPPLAGILYMSALRTRLEDATTAAEVEAGQHRQLGGMLDLVHAAVASAGARPPVMWVVTRGAQAVTPHETANAAQATLWGMAHVVATEHPELGCMRVDLDPDGDVADDVRALVRLMREEQRENQIAIRNSRRLARRLTRVTASHGASPRTRFSADATYLVTGGLRGLGLRVAEWLVDKGARHLVLMSRSGANAAATTVIRRLEVRGATVHAAAGDIGDTGAVQEILSHVENHMPRLRGVVHAAGVLDDGIVAQLTWERFARVLRPKVLGAWNLHTLTTDLDFLVLFSSGASLAGSAGQANYTAANAFEDALAHRRQAAGLPTVSINWGPWADIGAAANHQVRALQFMTAISPSDGIAALDGAMRRDPVTNLFVHSQVGVLQADWNIYVQQYGRGVVPPLFSELTVDPQVDAPGPPGQDVSARPADTLRVRIAAAAPNRRNAVLRDFVRSQTMAVLGGERQARIDDAQPLHDVGLDSLMAVELRNILGRAAGRALPSTLTFDHPTIDALVNYLVTEVFSEEMAPDIERRLPYETPPQPQDGTKAGSESFDNLSEDALAALLAEQLQALDITDIP